MGFLLTLCKVMGQCGVVEQTRKDSWGWENLETIKLLSNKV